MNSKRASEVQSDLLKAYGAKRNFARTGEPEPGFEAGKGSQFVVQKHGARRLHYDLRLELDGVLLSWAAPHGPSLIAGEKRLAVRTEDHPMKYLDFEGVIPKGEYGGGTMIVWDRGTWTPKHDPRKSLTKGHLDFELNGSRLKGHWHLVRMKPRGREKNEQWLLIKASDEHQRSVSDPDILVEETTSVLSGRSNKDLEAAAILREDHEDRTAIARQRRNALPDPVRVRGARKALLPLFVEPNLAALAERPPGGSEWLHEVKFDGYRLQVRIDAQEVKLLTRTGLDWTNRFSAIAGAAERLRLGSAILDGEVVVEDAAGVSRFNYLVSDLKAGRQDRFRYCVFDLIYLDGADLQMASLADRKNLLRDVLASAEAHDRIAFSDHFEIDGATMFEHVCRLGLEGIVSKRKDAPYRSGRGNNWLKSKCVQRQDFVVVGYVPSTTARRAVGSLVLGFFEGRELLHAGRVGSGFTEDAAWSLFAALEGIKIDKQSFGRKPIAGADKGVRWVEPRLVVEVEYRGWSADGVLRQASFQGIREDKDAREIVFEGSRPVAGAATKEAAQLTHPDRVLWPQEGITKQGLAEFYTEIAEWILPHLVGRPLSLVRCPGGIAAECFFAKHAWAGLGASVRRIDAGDDQPMLAIEDVQGLIALVQGNVLEIHPWGSTVADLERPDRLTFDLDPGEDVAWGAVIEGAVEARQRLNDFGLESFIKTTGGKGLHLVVPLIPSVTWAPAKAFCKAVVEAMAADSPARFVANMAKRARKGRIFVDYLRNGRGATAIGPYSTRARAGAAISTPLGWDELSAAVKSDHYRLDNLGRRLRFLKRDPWAGFLDIRQRFPNAADRG